MTINERISQILISRNETQKKLAQTIGVATSTVNNWLKLNRSIPAEYIIPISEFLEVNTNYLLTGTDTCQNNMELNDNDYELLDLFHQLPDRNQIKLIGYVERMLEELFGETISTHKNKGDYDWVDWDKLANEKPSVAADESSKKTGTTNSVK